LPGDSTTHATGSVPQHSPKAVNLLPAVALALFSTYYGFGGKTYLDAVYVSFITMTTVEFGDYVPNRDNADHPILVDSIHKHPIFVWNAWSIITTCSLSLFGFVYIKQGITSGNTQLSFVRPRILRANLP
jgi:hypothetical protein